MPGNYHLKFKIVYIIQTFRKEPSGGPLHALKISGSFTYTKEEATIDGSGFRVEFRVQGLGFRASWISGLGFMV